MATKATFDFARVNLFTADPRELTIIGLDTPHQKGEHPLWDERINLPVNPALVESIVRFGFRGSIAVKKEQFRDPETNEVMERAVVVNGRQRVRAAREANHIREENGQEPVRLTLTVERVDAAGALEAMVLYNENDTKDPPQVRAAKALRLEQAGRTHEQIAAAFGVAQETIATWLAYTELPQGVQALVESNTLGFKAATTLCSLPESEQLAAAQKLVESGSTTTEAARALVRTTSKRPKGATRAPGLHESPVYPRPTLGQLRAALVHHQKSGKAHPQATAMLLYVLGQGPADDVQGLEDLTPVQE